MDGGVPELEGDVSVVMLGVRTLSPVFMMPIRYKKSLIYCSRRSWSLGVVVRFIKGNI